MGDSNMGMLDVRKALGPTGVASLIPKEIDKTIQELMDYQNPLRQNLPRKAGSGKAWYLSQRTPVSTTPAAFYSATTDDFTEATGDYAEKEFLYKTLGARGKIYRLARDTTKGQVDLLAEEINARVLEFKNKEEWALLYGNKTTDSNQFDGVDTSISDSSQVVKAADTNVGDDLTIAKMDELIDACAPFMPDMLICSLAGRRKINALLQSSQRFVDKVEVKGGFKLASYNDVPIFVSTQVPDTLDYGSGVSLVAATGGSTSAIYALTSEFVWVGELNKLTYRELAEKSTQYVEFDIYEDVTVVFANYLAQAKLINFTVA
jgi:hypothetical protein